MPTTLTEKLEAQLRHISLLLYDTRVPAEQVDREVRPFCDELIRFTDPWQRGTGLAHYRLGVAGFHAMFKFDLEILQLNVALQEDGRTGRCIVDAVMHLKQLAPLLTYPLRTVLIYDFVVTDPGEGEQPARFLIHAHEEMWSFGDMLAAVPIAGWVYKNLFRKAFASAFLAASYLSSRAKGWVPRG